MYVYTPETLKTENQENLVLPNCQAFSALKGHGGNILMPSKVSPHYLLNSMGNSFEIVTPLSMNYKFTSIAKNDSPFTFLKQKS